MHQPYAEAICLGLKRFETRSFQVALGPLAVHAAKGEQSPALRRLAGAAWDAIPHGDGLPMGEVVCMTEVAGVARIRDGRYRDEDKSVEPTVWVERGGDRFSIARLTFVDGRGVESDVSDQIPFGDWTPNQRFAWIIERVVRLGTPIPARGRQGVWEWDWSRPFDR